MLQILTFPQRPLSTAAETDSLITRLTTFIQPLFTFTLHLNTISGLSAPHVLITSGEALCRLIKEESCIFVLKYISDPVLSYYYLNQYFY